MDSGQGTRPSGDPTVAIAAHIGGDDVLPEAVAEFAELYAYQTEHDYQAFLVGPSDRAAQG